MNKVGYIYPDKDKMGFDEFAGWASRYVLTALIEEGGKGFKAAIYNVITQALEREQHGGWR